MSGQIQPDPVGNVPASGAAAGLTGGDGVEVSGRTHPGLVRPNNEDNFHVIRFGRYLRAVASSLPADSDRDDFAQAGYGFAVADGVGGHAAGEVASRMALALLVELVLETPDWLFARETPDLTEVMKRFARRFGRVNDAVVAESAADPGRRGMGTTLTLAVSLGHDLIVAHVGDSPAYLLQNGRLRRLTRDHIAARPQTAADPAAARFRLVLTHAIGMPDAGGTPDVTRWTLADGDRLLLCTDGLTDLVGDDEIAAELGRASAEDACRALVDRALARGGRDNVTAVVAAYRFPGGPGAGCGTRSKPGSCGRPTGSGLLS